MKNDHAWQPPLDSVELLPSPTVEDLFGVSRLALQCLIMHAGKVACASGSINKPAPPDPEGDSLGGADVPDPEQDADISCLTIGFVSEEKVMDEVLVLEGGLDWENTSDLMDDGCDLSESAPEKTAVIAILFNRRWSAYEVMKHGVYGFYELLETLAHEIAHAMDHKHTLTDPEYLDAHGERASHQYLFNDCEVRARVWAALVAYCHLYVYASVSERWDWLYLPTAKDADSKWHEFVCECPLGESCLDEMNSDNRALFLQMLKAEAPRLLEDVRLAMQEDGMPVLPCFDATEIGKARQRPKDGEPDPVEAFTLAAEKCAVVWEKDE